MIIDYEYQFDQVVIAFVFHRANYLHLSYISSLFKFYMLFESKNTFQMLLSDKIVFYHILFPS